MTENMRLEKSETSFTLVQIQDCSRDRFVPLSNHDRTGIVSLFCHLLGGGIEILIFQYRRVQWF